MRKNDEELALMFDVVVVVSACYMGIRVIIVLVRHSNHNFRLNE